MPSRRQFLAYLSTTAALWPFDQLRIGALMTDIDNLDDLAAAISKSSPKIRDYAIAQAAATQSQELDIRNLLSRVAALEAEPDPEPEPEPPPPPPPTGTLLCINPNAGHSAAVESLLAQCAPRGLRNDTIEQSQVNWAHANGARFLGLATNKSTTETLALAAQFPTILHWELDNEPYFVSSVLADIPAWARRMRDTAKAMKQRNPNYSLGVPLYASNNADIGQKPVNGQWRPWVYTLIDSAPDIVQYVDWWSVHPYRFKGSDVWGVTDLVKGHLQDRNAVKPFHVTEVGWSVGTGTDQVTLAQQADFLRSVVLSARARGDIGALYVYSLRTRGPDFQGSFGIFNLDGSKRPAVDVFRSLV